MKERPILFSAPMVRAILNGSKTQTRRVVKQQVAQDDRFIGGFKLIGPGGVETAVGGPLCCFQSPYGTPGDRLWVRETFCPIYPQDPTYNGGRPIEYDYAATYTHGNRLADAIGVKKVWKPSIHMPRRASRITLEVTGVRVERLHACNEVDAIAEGAPWAACGSSQEGSHKAGYAQLWEQINGPGSWDANPWVWVVEFQPIDAATSAADSR